MFLSFILAPFGKIVEERHDTSICNDNSVVGRIVLLPTVAVQIFLC